MNLEKYPTFESWIKDMSFKDLRDIIRKTRDINVDIRELTSFQISLRIFIVFNFGSWRSEVIFKRNSRGSYVVFSYDEYSPLETEHFIGDWVEL